MMPYPYDPRYFGTWRESTETDETDGSEKEKPLERSRSKGESKKPSDYNSNNGSQQDLNDRDIASVVVEAFNFKKSNLKRTNTTHATLNPLHSS